MRTSKPEQVYLAGSDLLHTHLGLAGTRFDSIIISKPVRV